MTDDLQPSILDDLVLAWRGGDEGAFAALIEATEDDLRSFILVRCRDVEVAEELVQHAFVRAFERLDAYETRGTFSAWLKGIALNRWRVLARERARQCPAYEHLLDRLWEDRVDEDWLEERRARLQRCLEHLPDRGRALLMLHHVDGCSLSELARRFHEKTALLARRLFGLRARLRRCMEAAHGS